MPTTKQKEAFNNIIENRGNVSKGMRDAGYSDNSAKNPCNLTNSKGWEELVEEYLPDDLLAKVHKEGLEAIKVVRKFNYEKGKEEDLEEPDYATRHRYLDTAYKIKNKVTDKLEVSVGPSFIRLDE